MSNTLPATREVSSSVDNALFLLQLVGEHRVLRVSEAADLLGVGRSTAHRLFAALRDRGFVLQDRPNGPYRPGPALSEIGLAAIGRIDIRRLAQPVLEELRDTTQETSSLVLLEGRTVRFIDCVESPRSVRVGSRTGLVLPAHCTASGKAILATLPPADLKRRYAGQPLTARTTGSVTDWRSMEFELQEIRRRGVAINSEEAETGVCAIGAAVADQVGAPLAGVAVAVPASRMTNREAARTMAPAVIRAAAAIGDLVRQNSTAAAA
ncbi:IclR family transcriptional regulator [Paractinoplanes globisporus]|uniref:IclR family transcriptional regulator n=1 Tax=Paractinoplanes globisporus TaxID=113565 RepID=A0ABW6WX00_9ACTN|nr:IclR family transcriptional regulator [Actinoplanes globisporus]